MKDYGLYKYYTTSTTTTVRLYHRGEKRNEHVELDDTAPLPLFIGIGLALFIGFVILILICCLCRRRRPPSTAPPDRQMNSHYQRAPMNDGIGVGVSYPLASVPPGSYFNSTLAYPPPHMGHPMQHNYGVIGSGMGYGSAAHSLYPQQQQQQPPQFGGIPSYPPNNYIPSHAHTPHSTPHLSHSPSHSSQTSSSISRTTADPLVPTVPLSQQQQQHQPPPQLQTHHPHMQFPHQHHLPPASALQQQQQHIQYMQQQFVSGRQSPAVHYPQMPYSTIVVSEHSHSPAPSSVTTIATTPTMTSPYVNHPLVNNQVSGMVHSQSYSSKHEDD